MKFLILTLVLGLMNSVYAADPKKKVAQANTSNTMKELGKIDQKTLDLEGKKNEKAEIADETALYTEPGKIKVNISCKAKDGHQIKQGEAGYEECLQKVKSDKHNSKDPKADLNFQFGN